MIKLYVAVIEINGIESARSPELAYNLVMNWINDKKHMYANVLKEKPYKIYLLVKSAMQKYD